MTAALTKAAQVAKRLFGGHSDGGSHGGDRHGTFSKEAEAAAARYFENKQRCSVNDEQLTPLQKRMRSSKV